MGQGSLAEYLPHCPTTSCTCLAFSDSIQLGNQVGSSPENSQYCPWLSPSHPQRPEVLTLTGGGSAGARWPPSGLHLDLWPTPVAKTGPQSSRMTFEALEGLGLFSKSQA